MKLINPAELGAPSGYSNGVLAPAGARILFVAGQIGWNREKQIVSHDFVEQFELALTNVMAVVTEAGGKPEDVARLTVYVTDKELYQADLAGLGRAYRRVMGMHYPAMALVEVRALLEPGAMVEIEGTAAIV
jgi:enamine deaminase RidA (YjgF/YER057c/UK114 family)